MNQNKQTRSLKQLLSAWKTAVSHTTYAQPPDYNGPDVMLTNLVEHTSKVEPGSGFVARVRTGTDGHPYIPQAIERGAKLIVAQRPASALNLELPDDVVYLVVDDTAVALAWLSAAWYGFPSRELVMVGVTGTDGKTTTVNILHAILQAAGLQAGILSTLRAVIGDREEPLALHVTTPEAPVIQAYLRRMADAGMTHCVLETTSHGLAQHRVTAVDFDIAVVTNITHEHLDYHNTWDDYAAAKKRLFDYVANPQPIQTDKPTNVAKTIILNQDDTASYALLSQINTPAVLTYSIENDEASLFANDIVLNPWSTQYQLHLTNKPTNQPPATSYSIPIETSMFGLFNVLNMLAAAAAATALGMTPVQIQAGLKQMGVLYGRMQTIDKNQPFHVLVDFAHTPNGLEKAIDAARRTLEQANGGGRVITVFGSAGKRDPAKRRLMAEISARDADLTVLTAEDPRTESLTDILETMAAGCRTQGGVEGKTFWRIPDRGQAIYFALTQAQKDDLVLICGKGHEQSMCFVTTEYPWDDINATEAALDAFLAHQPMPNLGLPTFNENFHGSIDKTL
ncbi:MAG: UDP-N-acetylmuramoyl-L-alanyl-D-glutamate--2,6-diaminopimelate ligase [Anaerolineales bacterium]|nr:UDP-N-acetylmuramoyl-L-alanyl-D-glutamate--2,6-diaminopimelate ligase [Anaerolineales bacterium]